MSNHFKITITKGDRVVESDNTLTRDEVLTILDRYGWVDEVSPELRGVHIGRQQIKDGYYCIINYA